MLPFNSQNQSFLEIMGNHLRYRVPRFQRNYSWKEDQWEDLWQDVTELIKEQDSQKESRLHYMGYLVLQVSKNEKRTSFTIIDGQQRLTTISIFILAFLYELQELVNNNKDLEGSKERLESYRERFIAFKDTVSLQLEHKLSLNRNNDSYYKTYLCELKAPRIRKTNSSEKLMGKALQYFRDKIQEYFQHQIESQKIASFIESMVSNLWFTTIKVSSDSNAYTIFETLNARGVQLSTPDLVKNYTFSLIDSRGETHDQQLENLENKWINIIGQLGNYDFLKFVKVQWNSRNEFTRQSNLFKRIKTDLKNAKDATDYINALVDDSELYAALQDEKDEFWKNHKDGLYNQESLKQNLEMLRLFNILTPQSALMAAFRQFNEKDFFKFLRYIEIISLRYNIICDKMPNAQERLYAEIVKSFRKSASPSLKDVCDILKKINPSDKEFKTHFEEKIFKIKRTNKKARYLLYRIEKHLNKSSKPSFDTLSVEHILPQNPSEEWIQELQDKDKVEEWTDRIGNMTLVSPRINKSLGRKSFAEKREYFQTSPFIITKKCLDYEKWDEDSILQRQQWLCKQAKALWHFP